MRGCTGSIAEERLVQIVDRRHGELLEGGSSDGVAGAVSHALLAVSDPDGGTESGEFRVFIDMLVLSTSGRRVLGHDRFQK